MSDDQGGVRLESVLEVSEVDTYYGQSQILSDISLSLDRSEVVAILGRNGAGKTTLVHSIMGLVSIGAGRISFKGTDVSGMSLAKRSQLGLSLVPQGRRIIPNLTVEETLRIAASESSMWRLDEIYSLFPVLQERSDQRGGSLSGGEQQMLAIARALVQKTECLLLDEPFEGLAPQIIAQVRDRLHTVEEKDVSILIVEQNVKEALELADRVLILHDGTIVEEATPAQLREDPELYEKWMGV